MRTKREKDFWPIILLHVYIVGTFILIINSIENKSLIYLIEIIFAVIYLIFIVLYYMDYRERRIQQIINTRIKTKQSYLECIEKTVDIVRQIRHDSMNHLNTIGALCNSDKPNLTDEIHSFIERVSRESRRFCFKYDTGNDYLNVLLSIKNNLAEEKNISMSVEIKSSLSLAEIEPTELVFVLDCILDNSFEVLSDNDSISKKKIFFKSKIDEDKILISIKNNGPQIPDNILKNIFDCGFTTKPFEKSDKGGFGLFIAKKIIEENNGTVSVTSNKNETEFIIKFDTGINFI
jgi:sensor histidine kinase regulating citrate/malate metabolism